VPPSPGEGGGLEGTAQSQAFEDVEQDAVRESAQPVFFFMLAFIASCWWIHNTPPQTSNLTVSVQIFELFFSFAMRKIFFS
jgi:hypothetical protein